MSLRLNKSSLRWIVRCLVKSLWLKSKPPKRLIICHLARSSREGSKRALKKSRLRKKLPMSLLRLPRTPIRFRMSRATVKSKPSTNKSSRTLKPIACTPGLIWRKSKKTCGTNFMLSSKWWANSSLNSLNSSCQADRIYSICIRTLSLDSKVPSPLEVMAPSSWVKRAVRRWICRNSKELESTLSLRPRMPTPKEPCFCTSA